MPAVAKPRRAFLFAPMGSFRGGLKGGQFRTLPNKTERIFVFGCSVIKILLLFGGIHPAKPI
jgi:hypothetical protein